MRELLTAAAFTDIKIQIKENAADVISGWMPGSGAEKYITSAYVTATKSSECKQVNTSHLVAGPVVVDTSAPTEAGC